MHSACSHLPQTITNSSQEIYDKACRNTRTPPHSRIQLIMKILISNISSRLIRFHKVHCFRNLIESKGFPRTNQSITYISSTNNSHSPTNINRTKEKQELKSHGREEKKTKKSKKMQPFAARKLPQTQL